MAQMNDFSAESPVNYAQKCLCVLCLDTSGSMNTIVDMTGTVDTGKTQIIDGKSYKIFEGGVSRLDKLNEGIKAFYEDVQSNDTTSQGLEVAVITFDDYVVIKQDPVLVSETSPIEDLVATGETALIFGVEQAIEMVEKRKEWYKSTGQKYYRPWIVLITDGEPNQGQEQAIEHLAQRIKQDTQNKKYVFVPIGVDDSANMQVLKRLEGAKGNGYIPAMKLNSNKFSQFFQWLSASAGSVTGSTDGKMDLPSPENWWEDFSAI